MGARDLKAGGECFVQIVVPFYVVAELEDDWFGHFGCSMNETEYKRLIVRGDLR